MVSILEGEGLTLTRAVADAISLHPCQRDDDGHSADTCPSAIAALAAVRKWDAEHAPQPLGWATIGGIVCAPVPVDGDGD